MNQEEINWRIMNHRLEKLHRSAMKIIVINLILSFLNIIILIKNVFF